MDDLKALFHSIIGDSAQWAVLLGLLAVLLILLCVGFAALICMSDSEVENGAGWPHPKH
jgi:hypothetical protein